jgi:FtsH-binding integral membrane protein
VSNVFTDFGQGMSAFAAPVDARVAFIRRTYLHLAGAIAVFVVLSWAMFVGGIGEGVANWLMQGGRGRWFVILGGFMLVGWLGQAMAHRARSQTAQYAGLTLYTFGEALIFAPLLWFAHAISEKQGFANPLPIAATITLVVFAGLSAIVLTTKKDFSFLGMALKVGAFLALGLIVCGAIFGFSLGLWFSVAMVAFAAGAILYSTSNVLHQYRTDQHVGAALELFAAVALLFWYVLQLLMSRRN